MNMLALFFSILWALVFGFFAHIWCLSPGYNRVFIRILILVLLVIGFAPLVYVISQLT